MLLCIAVNEVILQVSSGYIHTFNVHATLTLILFTFKMSVLHTSYQD